MKRDTIHTSDFSRCALFMLRVALGWTLLYAGLVKLMDPAWSAAGYLNNAATFAPFFQRLAQPDILPAVNLLNEWGLTLLGASLILGIWVRLSGILAAVLMVLYYIPVLEFPYVGAHSFIVDDHIVYAAGLLVLASTKSGYIWGLARFWEETTGLRKLSRRFE